ncbi:CehA/McbA family metallohydrolase [candidate division KSB1 bacterium]|nr:CehA/McbA family metallohydrolase [candidate division KSB1 bacterium]
MITVEPDTVWFYLIPLLLYAEIHHRIWNLWSRYHKREPEIFADMPHRVGPGAKLPVLVCIKDANRYPISLENVAVHVVDREHRTLLLQKPYASLGISAPLWYEILLCDISHLTGRIKIDVTIIYADGRQKSCHNDNYKLTSHEPFEVFIDPQPRPRLNGWAFGDMHTHSHLTNDQVEFGAPFDVSCAMSRALELDFFAVADHSYDLDDRPDDYLINDPDIPKWRWLWDETGRMNNAHKDVVIIAGEELSVGNTKNRNVHQLIFNNRTFFAGSGDSAEKWFHTRPQHKIVDVVARLESTALSFAAHPIIDPPFVQKLLLRRGKWTDRDLRCAGLHGCQFWNGDKDHFLKIGLPKWIELLLHGHKIILIAGTDAHGNFNRYRQIGTPHLSMREGGGEIFGAAMTGVHVEGEFCLEGLLAGLRSGRVIVTDGPIAALSFASSASAERKMIGESVRAHSGEIHMDVCSSPSYGEICGLALIIGDIGRKKETRRQIDCPSGLFSLAKKAVLENCPQPGYVRLELCTHLKKQTFHCFTNPVYFD